MMEELRQRLPEELLWNVIKYMSHPCAEILKDGLCTDPYERCGYCRKIIFMKKGLWYYTCANGVICENCYAIHAEEIEREEEQQYEEYLNEQRVDNFNFYVEDEPYNSDSDSYTDSDTDSNQYNLMFLLTEQY
jgi:hypothetical protein